MARNNLEKVLGALSFFTWKQRKILVEESGLPRTTIYDNLKKLDNIGILETKRVAGQVGRPRTYYRLVA